MQNDDDALDYLNDKPRSFEELEEQRLHSMTMDRPLTLDDLDIELRDLAVVDGVPFTQKSAQITKGNLKQTVKEIFDREYNKHLQRLRE